MRASDRKGVTIGDSFKEYIRGFSIVKSYSRDAMLLYNETIGSRESLFSLRDVPVDGYPGKKTLERDYFKIEHPNKTIEKALSLYFLDKHWGMRDKIYGQSYDLGEFLNLSYGELLTIGECFYEIIWSDEEVNNIELILPEFRYLPSETMGIKMKKYVQSYSLVSYFLDKNLRRIIGGWNEREVFFDRSEILFFHHPFHKTSPSIEANKYVNKAQYFWKYGISASEASLEPNNRSLPLEKSRHTNFLRERRRHLLAKSKIKSFFNTFLYNDSDLKITDYYDIYIVVKYLKSLNQLRDYFVTQFNNQVFRPLAKKNKLASIPKLKYGNIMTNDEIDFYHNNFIRKEISTQEFIDKVIKK